MGLLEIILSLIGTIALLAAGFVISKFGFDYLFLLGAIIFLFSFISLLKLPELEKNFLGAFQKLLKRFLIKKIE